MIELKSAREIEIMARAGAVVGDLLEYLIEQIRPGIKPIELDDAAKAFIEKAGAKPAFLGYRGYPACLCVSVNEQVVHGIPGKKPIREGDIVSIDAGAVVDGFYGDAARTVAVGRVSKPIEKLIETTRKALDEGSALAVPGRRLSDISHRVQQVIEKEGFGVVRDFVGHGIGRAMHEDPAIPNYGRPDTGPRLCVGMVLAIEPMVTLGSPEVKVLSDGWTAVTRDGSPAAHFENTVAITENGIRILTERTDGQRRGD